MCLGDFNEIFYDSEKLGGVDKSESQIKAFREGCKDCGLRDLGYRGPRYTWWNNREEEVHIRCHLDRALANDE